MVPSRVAGGIAQSSSSSGIFFQGDRQSQVDGNSQLSSNFGNTSNLRGLVNLGPLSGDVSNTILNSISSGPSVGASSLVTDANSGLSAGPHLQRSASINTESYMRLPASPMSFTSNNISISGSSVIDGSSSVQPNNQDPGSQHQGSSSATSLPASRMGHVQLPGGPRAPNAFAQDPTAISHLPKRPRLDNMKQEDILQQQVVQQLMQRQDSMHLQNQNPQLQALLQQRLRQQQQQQLLQSMQPMQRGHLLNPQQQQQLRQQLLQQQMQPTAGVKRPYDASVCSRRIMQYLYHQRQRPAENTISYWRKFVAEYYSPRAKKRWCLSLYDNVGHHSLGVFPPAAMDAWQCDLCGSKSGRGFEATFEVLPRLNEIKFGSGVIDELLFLDLPCERPHPSGMMVLEYKKAVQESVYEQLRVVREGHLRIIFTPDLKIYSWEFCARRHEELLPRRLVAPQVNQLLQVAQKCQNTISESGPDGISQPDMQANSVMVVTAGRQLARSLELQSLNDLGFSKRYVRCLQIAEVVNSMKDLMDFSRDQKVGPTDGLKNFPRHANVTKAQKMQEMEMGSLQGLPTDRNSINKLVGMHPGLNSSMSNQHMVSGGGALSGSGQATHAQALSNYQNMMTRQNSMNSSHSHQHEPSSPFSTNSNQPPTPRSSTILPGTVQSSPQMQSSQGVNGFPQQNQTQPQPNQALQQHMIQQLLHGINNKKNGAAAAPQPSQNQHQGYRNSPNVPQANPPNGGNSSYRPSSNGEPSIGNYGFGQKSSDNLHISTDEMAQDIVHEFTENGFFNNDLDENFSWKA